MDSITSRLTGLVLPVFLTGALQLAAQPPAPVAETFSGSIDVRVVNVEAVVTDRGGRRVSGLTAKDFRLRVDGREMPIDSFAEVGREKGAPVAAGAGPAGTAGLPETAAPLQGRSLVVFIDESFAVKTHRDIVLKKLATQLGQLEATDRVAVVAFDGDRMAVLCDLTSDREALAAVLAKAQLRPANGVAAVGSRRRAQDDADFLAAVEDALGEGPDDPGVNGAAKPSGMPILSLMDPPTSGRMARIPTAVTATLRAFANAPGRKMMLLLAGGWPTLSVAVPVISEANRLGYTLYPVDVPGVDTTFVANDAGAAKPRSAPMMKDSWESNAEYTLEVLARATGGKAAIDSARLDALPRALEDSRSYYWLSFSPQWAGDDRSHTLELVVDRPGLKVRSRRSFVDLSAATRASLTSQDSTFLGGDLNAKRLTVLVGPPAAPSRRGQQVPFLLTIPLTEFAAGLEGENAADLVLTVQTEDDGGARTAFHDTPVHVVADPKAPGSIAHFKVTLPLARHPQRLIFTLREAASGTVLWGDAWVTL